MKLISTEDGSLTVELDDSNVTYHSRHGSVQESQHVFIKAGFNHVIKQIEDLKILEMGFGTGLNLLLTLKEMENYPQKKLIYHAVEKYPLTESIINQLNFKDIDPYLIQNIHQNSNGTFKNLQWKIFYEDIIDFGNSEKYHLIYYDAFAPSFQNELWSLSVFEKMYNLLENQGAMVTYCAKGEVKRNLKKAGFKIESLQGPPGKREMTRAIKK